MSPSSGTFASPSQTAEARRPTLALAATVVTLVAVAITDATTQLGFAHGALFLPAVLLAASTFRRRTLWLTTAAATALTALGAVTSPPAVSDFPALAVAGNRLVSVAMLLATALLADRLLVATLVARRATDAAAAARGAQDRNARLVALAGDAANLGGWSLDLRTDTLQWSDVVCRIHGLAPGETPTLRDAIDFYHPDDRDAVVAAVERCRRDGTPFDFQARLIRADGRRTWVHALGIAVRDAAGAIVAIEGSFQDVTADVELEERSRELVTTLEQISDAFFTLGPDWRFRYVNPQAYRVLQRDPGSLSGKGVWDEFPEAVGSDFEAHYRHAMTARTMVHFEAYFPPLDLWADVRAHPVRDGLAIYFQDMGERKRTEERLQTAQRLESVGQLTGGVAHDFNNLLTVVGGNAELLHERLAHDAYGARLAAMIVEAADRGASLTQALLAFARRQPLEPRPTDAHALVLGIEPLLRRSVGEAIDLRVEPDAAAWSTEVDPTQLESAVLNLVLNARDAMPNGGRLTVEIASVTLEPGDPRVETEAPAGDYVVVSVSDTGVGMSPEVRARAFEPFYTTKGAGEGSGMGLAMVYGFAKQSGGFATLYSEVGHGTTVRLYLPRDRGGAAPAPRSQGEHVLVGGSERILVVEDDAMVRAFAAEQLRALGYDVLEASDANTALTVLERERVALLFTDVVMPGGMSGKALADAATSSDPTLRVLFASGYTENAIVHHGRLDEGVRLLTKPYRRDELARRVREALDDTATDAD